MSRILPLLLLASVTAVAHADLGFNNFSNPTGMTLNGNAHVQGNSLRLTDVANYQAGSAWANDKQSVLSGFDTSFGYHIGEGSGADGFAFAIQGYDPHQIGANGGGLGLNDIYKAFGVEFRTWVYNSIDYNFYTYNPGMPSAPNNNLRGDHTVRISYDGARLNTYLDGNLQLSSLIDLANYLPTSTDGKYYVGFTSGTGGATDNHDITNWTYKGGAPAQAVPAPGAIVSFGMGTIGLWLQQKRRNRGRAVQN